ncbi:MAG TPA: hypothetical protein PLB01_09835 [Thermoanaerobaculia bacterium]|nr:hypothetical protein [Thermoanaerobaculia bacterium]
MTKRPGEAALLALVAAAFPGVGHALLGQRARGAAFCTIVLLTAATGLALGPGNDVAALAEYARTFLIVAGIMQALLVLDVFERARGRRG